jgi:hypothetical protein
MDCRVTLTTPFSYDNFVSVLLRRPTCLSQSPRHCGFPLFYDSTTCTASRFSLVLLPRYDLNVSCFGIVLKCSSITTLPQIIYVYKVGCGPYLHQRSLFGSIFMFGMAYLCMSFNFERVNAISSYCSPARLAAHALSFKKFILFE